MMHGPAAAHLPSHPLPTGQTLGAVVQWAHCCWPLQRRQLLQRRQRLHPVAKVSRPSPCPPAVPPSAKANSTPPLVDPSHWAGLPPCSETAVRRHP